MMADQVRDYRFPSGLDWALAVIDADLAILAAPSPVAIEHWEEDGLGTARGFFLKLPSGRVILLQQMDHVPESGVAGVTIIVDGGEAVRECHADLLRDVLSGLLLDESVVRWQPEDSGEWSAGAARILDAVNARMGKDGGFHEGSRRC